MRRAGLLGFALLAAGGACAHVVVPPVAVDAQAPQRVLFVGNSFTYYNNSLHNHYRRLVRAAAGGRDVPGRVRILTISGGHLPEHRDGLRQRLAEEAWDVVILQGHSLGPIGGDTAGPFRVAAADYADQIRAAGARPVFFMTWAYTGRPAMTARLDTAYTRIGDELGAQVVPVGLAFATVTRERPGIALRIADRRHPSLAGTYLAACTMYAALHDVSPVGLDYDPGLAAGVAGYLQQVAWQTVRNYRAR